jgi:hypothetical protein
VKQTIILAKLIEQLEYIKRRPANYIGSLSPKSADIFLQGFYQAACIALDVDFVHFHEALEASMKARGIKMKGAMGPLHQLIEKGWPDEKIITELIEIEMDCLRRMVELGATAPKSKD